MLSTGGRLLIFVVFLHSLHKSINSPVPESGIVTTEAIHGKNVILRCISNQDRYHLFDYWYIQDKNIVIGSSNDKYDLRKYDYDVLYGNLTIRTVRYDDEGMYLCVSKDVKENAKIDKIQLVVTDTWEKVYEEDPNVNLIRILIALITLVLVGAGAYVGYRIWKDKYRYPKYLEQDDADDDEDSAEEIFSAPSTSGLSRLKSPVRIIKEKFSDSQRSPDSDNFEAISTDFTSILDTANDK